MSERIERESELPLWARQEFQRLRSLNLKLRLLLGAVLPEVKNSAVLDPDTIRRCFAIVGGKDATT